MSKKLLILIPLCLALFAAVWGFAAGDASDPLASLSYLEGTFSDAVDSRVEEKLNASDAALLSGTDTGTAVPSGAGFVWAEDRLKQGDVLYGTTGVTVMLLAGQGNVTYPSGAVVDATDGKAVPSGTTLQINHRYIVAEDTTAGFTVTSKTAVVEHEGGTFTYSAETDYNAMAAALKTMHLFKGSFTGYGQGFDLEVAPTRLQALIMFIRVLGEEEQALAWTGTTPFTDIQKGSQAEKYVGYAYSMGYTNGYSATQFKPAGAVNAWQYTEFVLRAMGYSSAANTNLSDTLPRAQTAGVLTAGEAEMLQRDKFLRAELVYVSYYALDAWLPDGIRTLGDLLQEKGVFTSWEREEARSMVTGWRL